MVGAARRRSARRAPASTARCASAARAAKAALVPASALYQLHHAIQSRQIAQDGTGCLPAVHAAVATATGAPPKPPTPPHCPLAPRPPCRVAAPAHTDVVAHEDVEPPSFAHMSYNEQYDILYQEHPLRLKQYVPKPDKEAQSHVPGAHKVLFSDVYGLPRTHEWVDRIWTGKDKFYAGFLLTLHLVALAAPFTLSWHNFWMFMGAYFVTGALGITLSYHRQLTHRSFQTPKWLEYIFAYCGAMALQGDPIEWVSCHRYHHIHCDTPLDPHSPYEGFWWSHAGWLLDDKATQERIYDRTNATGKGLV